MQIPTSVLSSNYDANSFRHNGRPSTVNDVKADVSQLPDQAMAAESESAVTESVSAPESSQFAPAAAAQRSDAVSNGNGSVTSESFASSGNTMTDQYLQVANDTPMSLNAQDPSIFGVDEYV